MCKNIHVCAYLNVALAMPPRLLARVASIRQQQILSITGGEIATQNKDSSILFNMGRNLSAQIYFSSGEITFYPSSRCGFNSVVQQSALSLQVGVQWFVQFLQSLQEV